MRSTPDTVPARAAARHWVRATRSMPRCAHRQPADRGQRDRLPGGVLDAVSADLLADPLDPLAVRQHRRRRHRRGRGTAGQGRADPGRRTRVATAAPPTSASAACRACSSATTTCCTSATTTGPTRTPACSDRQPRRRPRALRPARRSAANPATCSARQNVPLIAMAHEIPTWPPRR